MIRTFRQYVLGEASSKNIHPDVEKYIKINFKNAQEKEAAHILYDVMVKHGDLDAKADAEYEKKTQHLDASRVGWVLYSMAGFIFDRGIV